MKRYLVQLFYAFATCFTLCTLHAGPHGNRGAHSSGSKIHSSSGFYRSVTQSRNSAPRSSSFTKTPHVSSASHGRSLRSTPTQAARTQSSAQTNVVRASKTTGTSQTLKSRSTSPQSSRKGSWKQDTRHHGGNRHRNWYGPRSWSWPYFSTRFWFMTSPCWADEWIFWYPWYPRYYFFYGYPYYPMITVNVDLSTSEQCSNSSEHEYRYPVLTESFDIDDNTVVMVQLPGVNQSQLYKEHGNYGAYYALFAASRLTKITPTKFSPGNITHSQTKKKLYDIAKKTGLLSRDQLSKFVKSAIENVDEDADNMRSTKLNTRKFATPSCAQLTKAAQQMREVARVTIGYESLPRDIGQVADLIATTARSASTTQKPQIYCLPSRRGSDDWVAVRIEKKGGVTYATIVDAMGYSRIRP